MRSTRCLPLHHDTTRQERRRTGTRPPLLPSVLSVLAEWQAEQERSKADERSKSSLAGVAAAAVPRANGMMKEGMGVIKWGLLFWGVILLSLLPHKGHLPLSMSSVAVDSLRVTPVGASIWPSTPNFRGLVKKHNSSGVGVLDQQPTKGSTRSR
jgi:hypothetical protein